MRLLIVAGALVALAACSSEAAAPAHRDPRTPPSSSPTAGVASPAGPTIPPMPTEAARHDSVGAAAFATWFWQMAGYANLTWDVAPLRSVMARSCGQCRTVATGMPKSERRGHHLIGCQFQTKYPQTTGILVGRRTGYAVEVALHESRCVTTYEHQRKRHVAKPYSVQNIITIVPAASGWKVIEWHGAGKSPDFG